MLTETELWNNENPASDYIDVPAWVCQFQDPTVSDIMAIQQGGCASGAWMPAVTYYNASITMGHHGDEVLDYLNDMLGELPHPDNMESWSGLACHYLSLAVEAWACRAADTLLEDAA